LGYDHMIHVATVHWQDDTWVDIQLKYFHRYLATHPYRIYAFLNGIDPGKYSDRIHYIRTDPIVAHAEKLNLLADYICSMVSPEDVIYFIDGDAFPVGDIGDFTNSKLQDYPLLAIQRPENGGDPQPHPSFCATTVKFWKEIGGDWRGGPQWKTITGECRSDVGGKLWGTLNEKQIKWHAMLRSNKIDLHPLWFGVYTDLIYHHGAGFRSSPSSVIDRYEVSRIWWRKWLLRLAFCRLGSIGNYKMRYAIHALAMRKRIRENMKNSRQVIEAIQNGPNFVKQFCPSVRQ